MSKTALYHGVGQPHRSTLHALQVSYRLEGIHVCDLGCAYAIIELLRTSIFPRLDWTGKVWAELRSLQQYNVRVGSQSGSREENLMQIFG